MRNDQQVSQRVVRSRYFWMPVWLAILGATGYAFFYLGQYTANEAASKKEFAGLAIAAMRDPVEGIQYAETDLLTDKISFDVYRDTIQAALKKPEIETVEAAFESMSRVIESGEANKHDMEKMIGEMKPIVLLALPSDGENVAGLDKEFRAFGMDTVLVTHKDESKDNAVICYVTREDGADVKYNDTTCNESAERVKDLLAKRGYVIARVTQIKRPNAVSDKRIDVLLAPIGKGAPKGKPKPR